MSWLEECLEGARENLRHTRERYPEHEPEATVELDFWIAALAFATAGTQSPPDRRRPTDIVINSVLRAADYVIGRSQEDLDSGRLVNSKVDAVSAHLAAWQRLREFTERY